MSARHLRPAVLPAALEVALAGCGSSGPSGEAATGGDGTRSGTDTGGAIEVPEQPQRVAASGPWNEGASIGAAHLLLDEFQTPTLDAEDLVG